MTSVVVCDDHEFVRNYFYDLLMQSLKFNVIAKVDSGNECISLIESGVIPDILILDISMPKGLSGYEVAKHLQLKYANQIKIVFLSLYNNIEVIRASIRLGAKAFIGKDTTSDEYIISTLEKVKEGEYVFPKEYNISIEMIEKIKNLKIGWLETLTSREIEFIKLLRSDKTYKQIADEMNISENTLENKRVSLFKKANVQSRTGLIIFFNDIGY
jgi:two-component system, NarL family, invasion response regulator UvrY